MSFQTNLQRVLEQEVSRRQFLLMVVTGVVALIGLERFVKAIEPPKRETGFGTGPYGGSKRV